MSLPGLWEFPGGKVEEGETPEHALRRELEEELLCTINVGEHVETTRHDYGFAVVSLMTFYATLAAGEPRLTEHSEVRWIPATELDSVEWAPADIPAVKSVMRRFSTRTDSPT